MRVYKWLISCIKNAALIFLLGATFKGTEQQYEGAHGQSAYGKICKIDLKKIISGALSILRAFLTSL